MTVRIVIPLRPPAEGKTRLAGVLAPDRRTALNWRLFGHVLGIAVTALPADRCFVVSRSREACDRARAAGAHAIEETGTGLNAALEQASSSLAALSSGPILTLASDLPLLETGDIKAMIDAVLSAPVAAAPDSAGTGTNALVLARPGLIAYRYGLDSLAAHRDAAERQGLGFVTVSRRGLATDVDTPDQLSLLHPDFLRA